MAVQRQFFRWGYMICFKTIIKFLVVAIVVVSLWYALSAHTDSRFTRLPFWPSRPMQKASALKSEQEKNQENSIKKDKQSHSASLHDKSVEEQDEE